MCEGGVRLPGILIDDTLMELISAVLIWLTDVKSRLLGPGPITSDPSCNPPLSHQLIKPGGLHTSGHAGSSCAAAQTAGPRGRQEKAAGPAETRKQAESSDLC